MIIYSLLVLFLYLCEGKLTQRKLFLSTYKTSALRCRKGHVLYSSVNESDLGGDISVTREAIVQLIEQSWVKVCQLVPQTALEICENELREATSLLVLASVRKSALTNQQSRTMIQRMFEEADINHDGQVSFFEWFEWLSDSKESTIFDINNNNFIKNLDPMIESLGRVLSHAVCTVKVASRIENDPFFLAAAFVAGGVSSGALDKDVSKAMLTRLSPHTRDLVIQALSLESGSMAPTQTKPTRRPIGALPGRRSSTHTTRTSADTIESSPSTTTTTSSTKMTADTTAVSRVTNRVMNTDTSSSSSSSSSSSYDMFFDQLNTDEFNRPSYRMRTDSTWSLNNYLDTTSVPGGDDALIFNSGGSITYTSDTLSVDTTSTTATAAVTGISSSSSEAIDTTMTAKLYPTTFPDLPINTNPDSSQSNMQSHSKYLIRSQHLKNNYIQELSTSSNVLNTEFDSKMRLFGSLMSTSNSSMELTQTMDFSSIPVLTAPSIDDSPSTSSVINADLLQRIYIHSSNNYQQQQQESYNITTNLSGTTSQYTVVDNSTDLSSTDSSFTQILTTQNHDIHNLTVETETSLLTTTTSSTRAMNSKTSTTDLSVSMSNNQATLSTLPSTYISTMNEIFASDSYQIAMGLKPKKKKMKSSSISMKNTPNSGISSSSSSSSSSSNGNLVYTSSKMMLNPELMLQGDIVHLTDEEYDIEDIDKSELLITLTPTCTPEINQRSISTTTTTTIATTTKTTTTTSSSSSTTSTSSLTSTTSSINTHNDSHSHSNSDISSSNYITSMVESNLTTTNTNTNMKEILETIVVTTSIIDTPMSATATSTSIMSNSLNSRNDTSSIETSIVLANAVTVGTNAPLEIHNHTDSRSTLLGLALVTPDSYSSKDMYETASKTLEDIRQTRVNLMDFDDKNSAIVRKVIETNANGRKDIISLAMALRTARLQHAGTLPNALKHRIAVETLQVWAPLSFQEGLSAQIPELEVHSYVLLFPQSFHSFLTWFDAFRPMARKILREFRGYLKDLFEHDAILPSLATKITIQSRIKTPSSAFKKMVKSSKRQQHLHDLLGLRVIVTENTPPDIDDALYEDDDDNDDENDDNEEEEEERGMNEDVDNHSIERNRNYHDIDDATATTTTTASEANQDEISTIIGIEDDNTVYSTSINSNLNSHISHLHNPLDTETTYQNSESNLKESEDSFSDDEEREEREEEEEEFDDMDIMSNIEHDAVYRVLDIIHSICNSAKLDKEGRIHPQNTDDDRQHHHIMSDFSVSSSSSHSSHLVSTDEDEDDDLSNHLSSLSSDTISIKNIQRISSEWVELSDRFKDYVTNPKPSGYQSLHLTLYHKPTSIQLELQIRSSRMHWVAEYGSASHKNYKALVLPTDPLPSSQWS